MDELKLVSGGFLQSTPPPEVDRVVVPGQRKKPVTGFSAAEWGDIANLSQDAFCNAMEGAFENAKTEASIAENEELTGAGLATFGVAMIAGGFHVCGAGTAATGGLGLLPSCIGGAVVTATGAVTGAGGGIMFLTADRRQAEAMRDQMAIRTSAVRAGCSAGSFK